MKTLKMSNGVGLKLTRNTYVSSGCASFRLVVTDVPEHLQDDYIQGETWATVTINLSGLLSDEFALNHDFSDNEEPHVLKAVMEYLTGKPFPQNPHRFIHRGFTDYSVYKLAGIHVISL